MIRFLAAPCCALLVVLQTSRADARLHAPVRAERTLEGADSALDRIMTRDLTEYFRRREGSPVRVVYEYLRTGPTVAGIAYPKYYLWVRATKPSGENAAVGAVRVEVIDSTIEVTHFFPRAYIEKEPACLDAVFPKSVIVAIRAHL
jgi:hypothetical protein